MILGMSTGEFIGQIFGVICIIAFVISNQLPKRWQMMLGLAVIQVISIANVWLVSQNLPVCIICAVGAVHCPINAYRAKKDLDSPLAEKLIFSALYLIAWGVGLAISIKAGTSSWQEAWRDILPLIATLFFIASMLCKKEQNVRLCTLGNAGVYAIFHVLCKNVAIVAQLINITSLLIALFRYRKKDGQDEKADNL